MSQSIQILRHLAAGNSITPLEALRRFGCMRLGARIWELKRQRWPIVSTTILTPSGKRVAKYRIQPKGKRP